ncbi:MAG: hypothetical protein RLZ97_1489, partial [Verrucomicrobiota bacterium]
GEAVIDDAGQIAETGGEAGFRIPGIDQGAALSFAGAGPSNPTSQHKVALHQGSQSFDFLRGF